MFENLLSFWKGKDFLTQVFEEFKTMLDNAEFMFTTACGCLFSDVQEPEIKQKIYAVDKKINILQKNIRKRIVEHLSLQPTVDVTACLLLMSLVKDAERLGDYSKNLFEVSELAGKPIDSELFAQYFNKLDKDIANLFKETKEAIMESSDNKAESSWDYKTRITKKCESILKKLAMSNLSVNETVCFTLIARYFKRISAHLTNIATSVVLPLSDLDYFDEKRHHNE